MAQVQCPNCGGFRVSVSNETQERRPTKAKTTYAQWRKKIVTIALIAQVIWVCAFLNQHASCSNSSSGCGTASSPIIWLVVLGLPTIIGALWIIVKGPAVAKQASVGEFYTNTTELISKTFAYTCQLCGYKWSWTTGTPLPTVTVRSDLMEKGEQRLRAEEEAMRGNVIAQENLRRQGIIK